ncbi:MAG: hypothetical protein A2133_12230 [Actinobacteria bacterium RBG_16_64_13]|nr:MAG: hypothetical protein A2133_12230 [Actinobacteria bacterium RBG_16_64_13]
MRDLPVSRREFLKVIGAASTAGLLSGGLGGLLAACDRDTGSTNTTATLAGGGTTTTTGSPTTVSSGPEMGRPVRIGLVSANSGPLALFGTADDWWTEYGLAAVSDGVVCGDGKLRHVSIVRQDCRSRADLAGKVARSLIADARVDIILSAGSSDVVNAVAGQAETLGCPSISDFVDWRAFIFDRGGAIDRPFTWTFAHAIGVEDIGANFLSMWRQVPTNKKIGLLLPDDAVGRLWSDATSGLPPMLSAAGYEYALLALYPPATEDFGAHIDEFKKNGCEICCGAMATADLITFWKSAHAQGYMPKVVTMAGALLFPQALEAIGATASNLTAECLWHPSWPYADSITGRTARELADDYVSKTGDQWTAAIAQYAKFEWAIDVFRRTRSIIDKDAVVAQVRTTQLRTCLGAIDFGAPVGADIATTRRPAENVCKAAVGGAQWVTGSAFAFEPRLAANVNNPELPLAGTIAPMEY